jgi:enoyl-CoA hydratase
MGDVLVERVDDVAVVRLNRPDKLNALTLPMMQELIAALSEIDADATCRSVILTGAGRGFCAGADLGDVSGSDGAEDRHNPVAVYYGQKPYSAVISRIRTLRQPVIAAVNGAAVGGGLALVLASDIRLSVPTAKFSVAFVKVGLSGGDMGVSWLLPRVVGTGVAHHLMLTGRTIEGVEAQRIGLVLEVHEPDALLDAAMAHAALIRANSPFGVAQTKEMMWASLEVPTMAMAMAIENRTQTVANLTADCFEAATALIERRPASFGNR